MRETKADTAQAVGLALALHGLLIVALLLSALQWGGAPEGGGSPMATELTDASDLSAAMQRTLRSKVAPVQDPLPQPEPEDALPQPEPEPSPQDAPTPQQQAPQDFIPVPDDSVQEQVVDTPTPNKATEQTVQEAKRQQDQVDLTEQERQLEIQRQQRLTAMELERQKQLEDIRRKRAAAAREASLAEQRLAQLADAQARNASSAQADASQPTPGAGGQGDPGLMAAYQAALQAAIKAKWTRPDSVPLGAKCKLVIRQLQGGTVIDVQVSSPCSYDEQARRSIEAAVLKAQPLPYAGFEKVFNRQLNFTFTAQDE
ncbi:TonB C-terminal domain-containing protein [Lysobacter sp. cf310]|uniref:TonB C-terminal domain-containing protein n=1 Tax=Lysobacter sp. cf310 TaxID=1761790 RepID=UPI0008F25D47|nr:TonB C-terminal domain-containing protein [Lysobacter sp. cf310]SFL25996.1 colicin import membrane protein [Lysobacter sp. cf310]